MNLKVLKNNLSLYFIMDKYKYSQNWFLGSEIRKYITSVVDGSKEQHILEIGCFEGLSSVFFADKLLENEKSSLVCIDPFMKLEDNDHTQYLMNDEEANFDHNISICKNVEKITVNKITSDEFFETNEKMYTFIYIDGCHNTEFITRDMENSFKFLESGGIMWMDDYRGGKDDAIKNTMDAFLVKYQGKYELLHTGYQLAIRKI